MGGFINNIAGSQGAAAGQAATDASSGFDKILTQIASGISDSMNGGQGGKAQGDMANKLENILSQLEDILAGLKGNEGAGQGAEGAGKGGGCEHSGKGEEAGGAQGEQAEQSDPISQLKELIGQLQENGMLSKEDAEKLLAQLDKMQAEQEGAAEDAGAAEEAGASEEAGGAQAAEEAKAGEETGEQANIIQKLEELIAQLKEKLGGAEAKQDGKGCCCPEAENAGSFMDDAGQNDYANMLESNKAA